MNDRAAARSKILAPVLLTLVILNLVLMARLLWPVLTEQQMTVQASANLPTAQPSPVVPSLEPSQAPTTPAISQPAAQDLRDQGIILLSMRDGQYYHLFAYQPESLPLTRLSNPSWDEIHPAVSPDGSRIAFSADKNGSWDLYVLNLLTGEITQLTTTPEYDGWPTWSPDGEWLAYESYQDDNLEIMVMSAADLSQAPLRLTNDPAADHGPAWSPSGRDVVFVSNRSGEEEIWLARLDASEDSRFTNLSNNIGKRDVNPQWSPDGTHLAWSARAEGLNQLAVLDLNTPESQPRISGLGDSAAWAPGGQAILSRVAQPNGSAFSIYDTNSGLLVMPLLPLPGDLQGFSWRTDTFVEQVTAYLQAHPQESYTPPQPQSTLSAFPIEPAGRFNVVSLGDVVAPYPMLHDAVDESFQQLRQAAAARTGWDFLGSLENAFIPLTRPSAPGMEEDWLYTGRAFSVNSVLLHAGWMTVIREEINGQTYWRVYLKARYQDGSQGMPLSEQPWDLDARFNGDPKIYEQGGQLTPIPAGYWIDFTSLAASFGWERLPAQVNWVTFYPAARFNQFVSPDGMDWRTALLELYPVEALATPTPAPPRSSYGAPTQAPPGP